MRPETRTRLTWVAIPIAIIVAVLAGIAGKWPVVVAMAIAVAFQVVSYRVDRGRRGRAGSGEPPRRP